MFSEILALLAVMLLIFNQCNGVNLHYEFKNATILNYDTVKQDQAQHNHDVVDVEEIAMAAAVDQFVEKVSYGIANNGTQIWSFSNEPSAEHIFLVLSGAQNVPIQGYFVHLCSTNIKATVNGTEIMLVVNENQSSPGTHCISWLDVTDLARGTYSLLRYYGCLDRITPNYVRHPDFFQSYPDHIISILSITFDRAGKRILIQLADKLTVDSVDIDAKNSKKTTLSMSGADKVTVIEYGGDDYVYFNPGYFTLAKIRAEYFRANISLVDADYSVLLQNENYRRFASVADGPFAVAVLPRVYDLKYYKDGILFLLGSFYHENNRTGSIIKIIDTKHWLVSTMCFDSRDLKISEIPYRTRGCEKPWFETSVRNPLNSPSQRRTFGLATYRKRLFLPVVYRKELFRAGRYELVNLPIILEYDYTQVDWDRTVTPPPRTRPAVTTTTTTTTTTTEATSTAMEEPDNLQLSTTEKPKASALAPVIGVVVAAAVLIPSVAFVIMRRSHLLSMFTSRGQTEDLQERNFSTTTVRSKGNSATVLNRPEDVTNEPTLEDVVISQRPSDSKSISKNASNLVNAQERSSISQMPPEEEDRKSIQNQLKPADVDTSKSTESVNKKAKKPSGRKGSKSKKK